MKNKKGETITTVLITLAMVSLVAVILNPLLTGLYLSITAAPVQTTPILNSSLDKTHIIHSNVTLCQKCCQYSKIVI